jgi:hypothetical protein
LRDEVGERIKVHDVTDSSFTHQAKKLSKQFQAHQIQRTYLAVVFGTLRVGFEGEIDERLRVDDDLVRLAEEHEGMEATTRWKCLAASVRRFLLLVSDEHEANFRVDRQRIACSRLLLQRVGSISSACIAPRC